MPTTTPNLSGTWKFNPARSHLQIEAPTSTTIVIEHSDPVFRFRRVHVFGQKEDMFSLELRTDGTAVVIWKGSARIEARAHWEGWTLVFESLLSWDGNEATNVVRYDLAEEGLSLIGHERFRSSALSYDNVWVMEKERQEPS